MPTITTKDGVEIAISRGRANSLKTSTRSRLRAWPAPAVGIVNSTGDENKDNDDRPRLAHPSTHPPSGLGTATGLSAELRTAFRTLRQAH